ncbi:MAG: ribonuclease P protein component [Alphaproteobacteria bacterium]|nr:ribonuclease P protein component [Alphaproteobacteria bacterium]
MALRRLKRRPDFLQVASTGQKSAMPGLVLQTRDRADGDGLRVGFTASRRVGGAVERNRAKRRLRAAAEQVLGLKGRAAHDHDYVLIARAETIRRPYRLLLEDLDRALQRIDGARRR